MAQASFTYRGTEYTTMGHFGRGRFADGGDGDQIIRRADGSEPRGSKIHPGMVQTGISEGLYAAGRRAILAEMKRETEIEA